MRKWSGECCLAIFPSEIRETLATPTLRFCWVLNSNCWFQQETLRLFSPKSDSHSGLRNTLLRPPVLIHPQVAFRVLISMAYSKFALGDGDSDSDWGDLSSECSSDSDDSDDSDCDVFGSRSGVLDITLFPV